MVLQGNQHHLERVIRMSVKMTTAKTPAPETLPQDHKAPAKAKRTAAETRADNAAQAAKKSPYSDAMKLQRKEAMANALKPVVKASTEGVDPLDQADDGFRPDPARLAFLLGEDAAPAAEDPAAITTVSVDDEMPEDIFSPEEVEALVTQSVTEAVEEFVAHRKAVMEKAAAEEAQAREAKKQSKVNEIVEGAKRLARSAAEKLGDFAPVVASAAAGAGVGVLAGAFTGLASGAMAGGLLGAAAGFVGGLFAGLVRKWMS